MATSSDGRTPEWPAAPDFDDVERLLGRLPGSLRSAFRAELNSAAPYERDRTSPTMARVQYAMLRFANSDLDRLRMARRLADVDWRDLLVRAEPQPTGKRTRREIEKRELEKSVIKVGIDSACHVLCYGGAPGFLRFVSLGDGSISDVPHAALAHRDDFDEDDPEMPCYLDTGAYGLLRTTGGEVVDFERRGIGRVWRPRTYETTADQRRFVLRTRKGWVRYEMAGVDTATVLGSRRFAHRWPKKGFVLNAGHEAAAFLPGTSNADWHRAQIRRGANRR